MTSARWNKVAWRAAAVFLAAAGPICRAEPAGSGFFGVIMTSGSVAVNGQGSSAGATLFPGDTVEARTGAALIQFNDGNRIELVRGRAAFEREGQRLVIRVHGGLLRFNFSAGSDALIVTQAQRLRVAGKGSRTVGGLAANPNGQLAVSLCTGKLVPDGGPAGSSPVTPGQSLVRLRQKGLGSIRKGDTLLTDATKSWAADELKGQVIRIGRETREVVGNGETSLTVDSPWEQSTGWHAYEASGPPGAQSESSVGLARMSVMGLSPCMTPPRVSRVVRASAAVAGAAVGLNLDSKSESTR